MILGILYILQLYSYWQWTPDAIIIILGALFFLNHIYGGRNDHWMLIPLFWSCYIDHPLSFFFKTIQSLFILLYFTLGKLLPNPFLLQVPLLLISYILKYTIDISTQIDLLSIPLQIALLTIFASEKKGRLNYNTCCLFIHLNVYLVFYSVEFLIFPKLQTHRDLLLYLTSISYSDMDNFD